MACSRLVVLLKVDYSGISFHISGLPGGAVSIVVAYIGQSEAGRFDCEVRVVKDVISCRPYGPSMGFHAGDHEYEQVRVVLGASFRGRRMFTLKKNVVTGFSICR